MKGIIIYYVVGPVHRRNLELIAQEMPNWTFRMLYEPECWWHNSDALARMSFEKIAFEHGNVPEIVWSGDVRAVIFSAVHPRLAPLNLLRAALERRIPTIAIEEANSMALIQGVINSHNNYLYPTDHVLVASEFERQTLINVGVPGHRIKVTGWPFYSGTIGKIDPKCRCQAKERFGFDSNRPVAVLTLTPLGSAGETPDVRRRQLLLASQGLPSHFQLVVKPHPIERLDTLLPFISECAPCAKVVNGTVPVNHLLEAADVLLNRGVSQVTIEALLQELPVIILSTGIWTPFHEDVQELVVEQPEDMARVIALLKAERDPMKHYVAFRRKHIPYIPTEALKMTCQCIAQISNESHVDPNPRQQWLELALFQAWQFNSRCALDSLSVECLRGQNGEIHALKDLIKGQATLAQLEELKIWAGNSFREQILRCLWINQLHRLDKRITPADIDWIQNFPPRINEAYFFNYVLLWVDLLLRSGEKQEVWKIVDRIKKSASYNSTVAEILCGIKWYDNGWIGRFLYMIWRIYRLHIRSWLILFKSQLKKNY